MPAMDYDQTTKFITSLAKFLQTLCNGYVDFNNWVQINGHLILSVDSGETKEFVVNEKLCKTLKDNISFLSNSYHAPISNSPLNLGTKVTHNNNVIKPDVKIDSKISPIVPSKGRGRKQAQPQKLSQENASPPVKKARHSVQTESIVQQTEKAASSDHPIAEKLEKQCMSNHDDVKDFSNMKKEPEEDADLLEKSLFVEDLSSKETTCKTNSIKLDSNDNSLNEVIDYSISKRSDKDSSLKQDQIDHPSDTVLDYSTSNKLKLNTLASEKETLPGTTVVELSDLEKPVENSKTEGVDTDKILLNEKTSKHSNKVNDDLSMTLDYSSMTALNPTVQNVSGENKILFPGIQTGVVPGTVFIKDRYAPPLPLIPTQLFNAGLRFPAGISIPGFTTLSSSSDKAETNQVPFTVPFGGLGNSLKVKLPFPTKDNVSPPSVTIVKRKKSAPKPEIIKVVKEQIQSDKISTSTSKTNEIKKEYEIIAEVQIKEESEEPCEESVSPLSGTEVEEVTTVKSRRKRSSRNHGDGFDEDSLPKARHNEPLSAHAVSIMSDWFYENVESPYPSRAEMVSMAKDGGIAIKQVKSWFANKRNRTNNTKPKVQVRAMEEKLLEVCQDLQMRDKSTADNSQILMKLSEVMSNLNNQKE